MPTVGTNGIETFYEEYGKGPPMVFLHGGFSDHALFAELMQPLAEDFRVIVYDLRGHGLSGRPDIEEYSIDYLVDDLAALIEELGLDQPVVCGLSMGGMVAYRFATEYPDRLSGLVTLGARTPKLFTIREKIIMRFIFKVVIQLSRFERTKDTVSNLWSWVSDKISGEDSTVDLDKAEQLREEHGCEFEEFSFEELRKVEHTVDSYFGSQVYFQAISVPTLVMFGENEPWVDPHWEYMSERIPDAEFVEVPDAPHNSHVGNPEFIMDAIKKFVEERMTDNEVQAVA